MQLDEVEDLSERDGYHPSEDFLISIAGLMPNDDIDSALENVRNLATLHQEERVHSVTKRRRRRSIDGRAAQHIRSNQDCLC